MYNTIHDRICLEKDVETFDINPKPVHLYYYNEHAGHKRAVSVRDIGANY